MRRLLVGVAVALLGATASVAQDPDTTRARADSVARARADSIRQGRGLKLLDSLTDVIHSLQARMDSLARAGGAAGSTPADQQPQAPQAQPVRAGGAYMNIGFSGLADFGWSTEPNVGSLQRGDHDPLVRGFTIPNV
ncbi:MAG TPA: hypothetical protein VGQ73_03565, partial [Gemmatimonadales bacterium]|nr:hypothetical protein [Gemmatimonadales bacterium]